MMQYRGDYFLNVLSLSLLYLSLCCLDQLIYFIARMMKKLLLFIVLLFFIQVIRADRQEDQSEDDDKDKHFNIISISQSLKNMVRPIISSIAGGTKIYIKAKNHDQDPKNIQVFVGTFPCIIPSGGVNQNYITCETSDSKSAVDIYNLPVTVISNKKTVVTKSPDIVHYQWYMTPMVNELFPSVGFSQSYIYMYGTNQITNVGDGKDVGDIEKIMIGDHQCKVIDIPQTSYNSFIKCLQQSEQQGGKYNITQKLKQGQAEKNEKLKTSTLDEKQYFQFTLLPTISSVSSNKGEEGGQKLKIKGSGFSKNKKNNTVSVDGNPCKVVQADNDQLSCILSPRNISISTKLSTNTNLTNQTKGYISGAGLNYIRYSSPMSLAKLTQDFRAGVSSGAILEKGFRAQLKEFSYNSYLSQVWSGYFTPPVDGTYTFRGYAGDAFSFYLSQVYGSAQPPANPLISSYTPTSRWSSFYYDDIQGAQASVNLVGGKSYYLQAYHSAYWSSYFKISVDVPNSNTNLPYQTFQVQRLFLNTSIQPEVVTYSMSGGTNKSSINLKIVRKDSNDKIYYNQNVTVAYGCSQGEFYNALMVFDSFYSYRISVVRKAYQENNTLVSSITNTTNITRYDYEVSFFFLRSQSVQNQNFILTKYNFTGNFTKKISIQHSPLISGTFSFSIGGVQFNNVSYNINEGSLQALIRNKIQGYQKVQVEFISPYGCEYWCTWIISYRGVNSAIPTFLVNTASLKGGITQPNITHTIRRPYSSSIIFQPIDYRFLGTASNLPSVLVNTNGLPAICTGDCSYEFIDIGKVTYNGYFNNHLTLFINYTINTTKVEDLFITINDKYCKIEPGSMASYLNCTVEPINGQTPLTAGIGQLQVEAKPHGIVKIQSGINPLIIPLIVINMSSYSGGLNGGSVNTLFGSGFSPNKHLITLIICNKNANIINSNYHQMSFFMPPCEVPGVYTLLVMVGGLNNTALNYTYNSTQAPVIASLYPKSSNPTKKTKMYICGSGYGSDPNIVSVHLSNSTGQAYQLKILNINNSCIQVGLSGGLPGNYTVEVAFTNGTGLAIPSSPGIDIFTYQFAVTSVTPNTGSYFGGTLLNISGINFSPQYSDTLVYVGFALNWFCRVQNITQSYVTCRTPPSHPNYELNQSLEISMSSKVYMMSKCPQNNCFFTYMDPLLSPNLTSISTSVASTSPIIVTGNNFLLNSSVTCQIVLSNEDGSSPLVLPTSFCNSTSAQFVVQASVPAGSYYVKVRNSIGESNPLKLTVNLVLGSPSLTVGSMEGAFVTFTGGSGYPLSLGGKNYISLYAPSLNTYYDVNITNYSSTGLTVQVPPNPNSTTLNINFVTSLQTSTQNFISSNYYTPSIYIPSQVFSPGIRSITFQRDDALTSLPILTITLVSTVDSNNNISIPLWNTTNQTTYSFSARLYAGAYRILAYTTYGFCKTNTTINVQVNNGSSIASRQVSFAGDRIYLIGSDLSPSSYIKVNGFIGNIISYNTSCVTYRVPTLTSTSTQNYYKLKKVSLLSSSLLTTFSDNNDFFNSSSVIDGDKTTLYGSSAGSCWVGIDVGQNLTALIDRITYFPQADWENVAKKLTDAVFEGSNDKVSWVVLGKIDQSAHIGWNTIKFSTSQQYRYIRFKHNSTSQCNIAELKLYGIIYTNQSVSTASQSTNVVYYDGYNKLSFANVLQFRLDKTPIVSSVTPPYGDVFGGYNITITGKYLNVTTPVVYIDSISCSVFSANQTHILCTVGARPNIPKYTNFTVLVGTSEAVMDASFLYVLKWSDQRTWGVDLPPIDGDLVFVPAGMTLLVDQSTPHLLGITAQDGTIIFSNETDITVYTGFITMNGGTLIAGTQSNPLYTNLKIVLEGNIYGAQQPIFGNKGIGCLDCKLSIYGKPRQAWTTIGQTINPGDTNFTVSSTVDWKVGEQIAVASTSFNHQESESKFITSISGNVINVDSPFVYQHVSIVQSYGSSDYLQMKAEVGLLSRNIKITGDDESNTTQYGAHLLATKSTSNNLEVQIGYTEFTQCGQPYIPGRYCIFFSKTRQVPTSFVRGNAVHNSYARLIGLNKVEYLTIQNNVGYRIKGHNIYLQSGTQIFNTIRSNLIISSLSAPNMMQSDYSVSSFWITHPNNHVYENHAAGSDYYGISYQIGDNTQSVSDICPIGNALGYVANNVIHSNRKYGMRIYKLYSRVHPCQAIRNDYYPDPWSNNPSIASIFYNFVIYKNSLYGVLAEQVGHLVFSNFTVAQNYVAGIQIYIGNFTKEMVSVTNSTIIGKSKYNFDPSSSQYQNMYGVVTPRTGQSNITNVRFYNFVSGATALATCSQCFLGQYATNVGNQIFIKNIQFSSIDGRFLSMIGYQRDIIYDIDGSLSSYFFNSSQSSATIVYGYNHITQYHPTTCKSPKANASSWSSLVMCDSSITIRRIMFTNMIGAINYYDLFWTNMFVNPITNVSQVINSSNINTNIITVVPPTYPYVEKPYSWSLPFVTGTTYQVWWGDYNSYTDYNHLSITTTPLYTENDLGIVFKIPYILNRELYSIGPMRNYQFPTNDQLISPSVYPPVPSTCINGEYSHNNDVGSRMLSICQSGKNKTKFQYTQVNAIFCKYVCPLPPASIPSSSSSVGIVVKQSFVRLWSNASQWPNQTIPQYMQDVYVNANWTILLDMDPFPANYMIFDGTVVADDTRDVFITARSIHIRAGNLSVGNTQTPFTHKFIIQINNTYDDPGWVIDPLIAGNKYITVTGSLNLYGSPPSSVITDLTQTAFANSSHIYVSSSAGWQAGDLIALSPSFGKYQEYQQVTIQSINSNGSISVSPALKYTHYGSSQQVTSAHGLINVNTKVGHLTRNIKIVAGPDSTWGLDILVYGYVDDIATRRGTVALNGVEMQGTTLKFINTRTAISTVTSCSVYNTLTSFLDVKNSNQISLSNNFFFNSANAGVIVSQINKFNFNSNLITGVNIDGCFSLYDYLSPNGSSIKNNFCLGAATYGFALPHIKCQELQTNPMANNTAGSCNVGFIFNNIETSDKCKAFSYIKAYACKIGQTCNPMKTSKLVFEHFILADNERGATLKFGSEEDDIEHIAQFSYSYITPISRPTCAQCYGPNAIKCSNNLGMRLLSVSGDGQSLYSSYQLQSYDDITTAQVLNSKAYLKNVIFDNFRTTYSSSSCVDNYVFRPHPNAHDAVATHVLYDCSCTNCDNSSYLLADPNNPDHIGWYGGCGSIACTGKSNYLIIDPNGTFIGYTGTIIPNKIIGYNEPQCYYFDNMNAFNCYRSDFTILAYQSTAEDYNTRIMWPVNLTYDEANYSTLTNGWREWDWVSGVPQNHRLGRFLSIVKLNSVYNMTFTSMAPLSMELQLQKRGKVSNASSYIIVKLRYPLPNLIRIHANGNIIDPIPMTDAGLRRPLNKSKCGDNIYFYKNYTSNFVITEGDCLVKVQLLDTVQLTTKFAMTTDEFFTNSVMSSYINNLCALLGIQDTSRVKTVGVFSGSIIVNTMIMPPTNTTSADNSTTTTSANGTNITQPSLVVVQQILSQSLQSGTYSSSMLNATGYQVLTGSSTLYLIQSKNEESSISSTVMLIGIIVGCVVLIILLILLGLYCKRRISVDKEKEIQSQQEEKEIVASDSVLFSNESAAIVPEVVERDHKNRKNRVTNNMKKNIRRAKQNTNLQIKDLDLEPYDFEE